MSHINRKYIDKHWLTFVFRGALALVFGWLALFWGGIENTTLLVSFVIVAMLIMGIIDSVNAIYCSAKKRGWLNSVLDAALDVIAALCLLFVNDSVIQFIVIAIYTFTSGVVDILHGFLSTVDPTDRFIRIVTGICGCVMGIVILNAMNFGDNLIRFFGAYYMIVGVSSLIYGVHNRSQKIEDHIARKEIAKAVAKKRVAKAAKAVKSAKTAKK